MGVLALFYGLFPVSSGKQKLGHILNGSSSWHSNLCFPGTGAFFGIPGQCQGPDSGKGTGWGGLLRLGDRLTVDFCGFLLPLLVLLLLLLDTLGGGIRTANGIVHL